MTGVGVAELIKQASRKVDQSRLVDCLSDMTTIAGSNGAASALSAAGVTPTLQIDSPTSWRDILMQLDREQPVVNQRVALEESAAVYELANGLEARGARVVRFAPFPQSTPQRPQALSLIHI